MEINQLEKNTITGDTNSSRKAATKKFEQMLGDYEYERPKEGQFIEGEIIRIEEGSIFIDIGTKHDAIVSRNDINNLKEDMLEDLEKGDQLNVYVVHTPRDEGDLMVSISKGLELEDWDRAERCLTSGEILNLEAVDVNRGGLIVVFDRLNGFVPNSHLPELRHVRNPKQAAARKAEKIGSHIPLRVIEVDQDKKRLILSAKAARQAERIHRLQEINPGDVLPGKVVNIVDYGVFVDLGGITGLLHVSEFDWYRVDDPSEEIEYGEEIEVLIKDVDIERERIGLSRKDLLPNPWDSFDGEYSEGDLVEGVVSSLQDYGAFVRLPKSLEGLIHVSEMDGSPEETLSLGQTILVRIIDIDPQRERIGLSLTQVTQDEQLSWVMNTDESQKDDANIEVDEFDK